MLLPGQQAHVVWTYSDYCTLPSDGKRYEIIDGELFVTPSPTSGHQHVSKRLQYALMTQVEEAGHGIVHNAPLDVILDETRVVQPDLLVVRQERRHIIAPRGVQGAPDLVVEILSPGSSTNDRVAKSKLYASAGVREYWIVDPEACTVEVFALQASGYVLRWRRGAGERVQSEIFPVDIPLDRVFGP